ncbi:E3 ubiquitin-protein ligase TRAIP isoform X1 [Takifugu rubripes]|uniref:TRAF-interacting protein n=1 Tax=Takifugu rubripes TaxID=31033 RepID=H2UEV8_TAKRU|nr:E3 ubiquitin-protein ligase TRAIP isoform X1 [Takifugu rubripes]XP_029682564.1 E3 ubiquitin-protein ligase TRAIP isoform X1 [Takifugu rubripes]|eukprot:XP_011612641.1 PREDICTED: E3 ubiquitin-protein ligase TRAIP isoform X1 [Takifugu rubripes]
MPIRAQCTICSDFFDHSRDVAAIHCGHTFHHECLVRWFQTAPTKTCPQCRKQVSTRHIISRLYFDVGLDDSSVGDPESLQNELDRVKVNFSSKERDWREKQKAMDDLMETVELQRKALENLQKDVMEKEKLCSALRTQMTYLESQHNDTRAAKEEVRRLRIKMKTFESLDVVLQGQRAEVESMITDMGIGQAAVEQLSIYCISLKKEYDNLKGGLKSSNEMCEKLKREVLTSNNKLHKALLELTKARDDMKSLQNDLTNAEKEISSLKKKVEFLQEALSTPTRTNEALGRLFFESPAPLDVRQPCLHPPSGNEDIDLNMTYDVTTPDDVRKRPKKVPSKKMHLDSVVSSSFEQSTKISSAIKRRGGGESMDPFFRNSFLFRKKTFGSMLDPQRKTGVVQSGYDGLGGRTKFIQPSPLAEIRPLMKAKRKKVTRPPSKTAAGLTLDSFLE